MNEDLSDQMKIISKVRQIAIDACQKMTAELFVENTGFGPVPWQIMSIHTSDDGIFRVSCRREVKDRLYDVAMNVDSKRFRSDILGYDVRILYSSGRYE